MNVQHITEKNSVVEVGELIIISTSTWGVHSF